LHGGKSWDTIMRGLIEEISAMTRSMMRPLGGEREYIAHADRVLLFPLQVREGSKRRCGSRGDLP
jgi:hypothetical protein